MKASEKPATSNLESFACLWLDQNINSTQDNRDTLKALRQAINHLRTFDDSDAYEQYIRQINQEKVILIVSGSWGRQIIPRLHDLPQLSAFYVFCQDHEANEQWANKYHKNNGVFTDRAKLIAQISKDQVARTKVEDGAAISVISSGAQSLEARNAIFMWFQLFIEVLLRMHHKSSDRQELIEICKKSYKGNDEEMKTIAEFEKTYKPENAIWWYTRESCFYRMMNKALRVQDFDMLFAFRFLITDIAKQIKNDHDKFIRTSDTRNKFLVYRGQIIGKDELELMKNSVGQFLSMNSFLSTSRDRSTALHFSRLTPVISGVERVIFEIEIDPRLQTKAFADITQSSYFQNEDEILIILGALFRIEKITEDKKDRLWVARLSLASEDDFHLKETFAYMKDTIGDDTDLDSLGKILLEMGEYDQSQKCYERMMHDLQVKMGDCHMGFGKTHFYQKQDKPALVHLEQAMKVREEVQGPKHTSVGEVYNFIGALQWYSREDYDGALVNLKKAVTILEEAKPCDFILLSRAYSNMASTYQYMGKYSLALEYYNKCLAIRQSNLPANHPYIAATYNNLGWAYENLSDYEKALKFYRKSLSIKRKILPPTHEDIVVTEDNIRRLENAMKK
ncbi:unnamed protein product [Adineta steineri]|uniref:ADP ribosyltransferase domain-containing protein n=1 Tax=Adineta steineri TaxID=433720 RepID=A0A815QU83_9BILA|nr:unnamed protein product [Adineta steineri]CAF1467986.1 unnamed protein product [Adineta steineri]